jgi:hypothetical protein
MFDLSVLKTMSAIRPIATLGNYPQKPVRFDKFYLERVEAFGTQKTGIVLSVNTTPHIIEQFDIQPRNRVLVRGEFDQADRDALLIKSRRQTNRVVALTDTVCAMDFQYARLEGRVYQIEALQKFFNDLRRCYHLAKENGPRGITCVMHFPLSIGTVKFEYTSLHQIEATLYPMAYHFFKDDTEL